MSTQANSRVNWSRPPHPGAVRHLEGGGSRCPSARSGGQKTTASILGASPVCTRRGG